MRLLEGLDEFEGSLYRQSRSVPRRAEIGSANQRSVACRTTWRRRALVDELADKLGLFRGELARWSSSGGAVHGRGLLPTPACRQGALTAAL